jgi:hypothetical protein
MGEKAGEALGLEFDNWLRVEFRGAGITLDVGLLVCREVDGILGLTEVGSMYLQKTRGGRDAQQELVPLLWQSVYGGLEEYEDTNDAARLASDPAMQAAGTSALSRFQIEVLVTGQNLMKLEGLDTRWEEKAVVRTRRRRIILDMGSPESPVYGDGE